MLLQGMALYGLLAPLPTNGKPPVASTHYTPFRYCAYIEVYSANHLQSVHSQLPSHSVCRVWVVCSELQTWAVVCSSSSHIRDIIFPCVCEGRWVGVGGCACVCVCVCVCVCGCVWVCVGLMGVGGWVCLCVCGWVGGCACVWGGWVGVLVCGVGVSGCGYVCVGAYVCGCEWVSGCAPTSYPPTLLPPTLLPPTLLPYNAIL